jgi:hypothetical protein
MDWQIVAVWIIAGGALIAVVGRVVLRGLYVSRHKRPK